MKPDLFPLSKSGFVYFSIEVLLIGKSKISEDGAKELQQALPRLRFSEQT